MVAHYSCSDKANQPLTALCKVAWFVATAVSFAVYWCLNWAFPMRNLPAPGAAWGLLGAEADGDLKEALLAGAGGAHGREQQGLLPPVVGSCSSSSQEED